MKFAVAFLALLAAATAFAPIPAFTRTTMRVFAGPPEEEEEEGLDLNLEEMFEM
jgi:hypothetical protein